MKDEEKKGRNSKKETSFSISIKYPLNVINLKRFLCSDQFAHFGIFFFLFFHHVKFYSILIMF